jgi:ABC-type polysaccharide/polyol phosphate transport system ATPase subunit
MTIIDVQHVSKQFRRHIGRKLIREQLYEAIRRVPVPHFYALEDVTFKISAGESVAIIGANGAGKSTLLSIIAGLCAPDSGYVRVHGRIAPLLELGSGFHPDLTGNENVLLNAALLGYTRREAEDKLEEIIDFSELGDFVNEPIRTYSSGMVVRLAFSVAVHADPGVLIVDEVLGVGDSHFQEKCVAKIRSLRAQGKTLLCVSHSAKTVLDFCDRAIWLRAGRLEMDGDVTRALDAYTEDARLQTQRP